MYSSASVIVSLSVERFGLVNELFGSSWSRQKCAFTCLPCELWIKLCDSHINDERNL